MTAPALTVTAEWSFHLYEDLPDPYQGPLDVWIKNHGEEAWIYAGSAKPYGRTFHGWRYPDYRHLLTGSTHTCKTEIPPGRMA